ncbi:hypothetical protein FJ251_13730 [bacterium]|nr:hypothetical protein [bacterium]
MRWLTRHRPETLSSALGIFVRAAKPVVRRASPEAPAGTRFGAVAFVHHFGAALNDHTHFHCLITDGRFAATPVGEAIFYEAGPVDIGWVQAQVRRRVLAWLVRHDYMKAQAAVGMLAWRHSGGFSVDASVRLAAWNRQGLERLARYCARPSFSSARLDRLSADTVAYRLTKPLADGRTCLYLKPLTLLARLAALIPPPRQHRTRYYGALAPHARLRSAVIATAGPSEALAFQLRQAAARMELASKDDPPAPALPPPRIRSATPGPCCWRGSTRRCSWSARAAAAPCESSLS